MFLSRVTDRLSIKNRPGDEAKMAIVSFPDPSTQAGSGNETKMATGGCSFVVTGCPLILTKG